MERILVPLDGSDLSELALPYASFYGKLLKADVSLLHVITEGDQHDFVIERERISRINTPAGPIATDAKQALEQHSAAYLAEQAEPLRTQGLHVQTEVSFGVPAATIITAAEHGANTWIIMATHGRGSLGRWLVGSVAHKVLRKTTLPLLAVRGPAPEPFALRRIMVPLDGSAQARDALVPALDLAHRAGAALVLLTVLPPRLALDPSIMPPVNERTLGELRERLLHEVDDLALESQGVPITTVASEGLVGDTVSREAERQDIDLIVMTTHASGGRHLSALGNVTDNVLHSTRVPILIIANSLMESAVSGSRSEASHLSG